MSSQIGCAENCQFCMTGKMGLVRNLTAGEILGQVFFARKTVREHGMVSVSTCARYAIRTNVENLIGRITFASCRKTAKGVLGWAERKAISDPAVAGFRFSAPSRFSDLFQLCIFCFLSDWHVLIFLVQQYLHRADW